LKILILKPSALGDVIQALPVLRLLKLHFPAAEIFWWIDSTLQALLEADPDLDGILLFERRRWVSPLYWDELLASVRRMRALKFDWVIDLQSLARSGAFAWMANGELTIGLDDAREGARGFYDVVTPRLSFHTHAVEWYLETLRLLRVPVHWNFTWLPERGEIAARVRQTWPTGSARWLILQPGARWTNKRWPVESFAELARRLAAELTGFRFVILGGNDDIPLGQTIAQAAPDRCLDLTGKTTLPEMVEWIRLCELMVTNDTGPMHVAAAMRKPVIALFGPTEPRRTGPYGQVHGALQVNSLPCVPCFKDTCAYQRPFECLRSLSPVLVQAEVLRLLEAVKH